MRVTVDEAARQKEAFEEYMDSLVGEDITVSRGADFYRVEILRKRKRVTHPKPETGHVTIGYDHERDFKRLTERTDI